MREMIFAVAAVMMLSGAAVADEAKTNKAEANAGAQEEEWDPNRRICKITTVTGSRLDKQRVCMTAAEWEQMRRDNSRMLNEKAKGSLPGE